MQSNTKIDTFSIRPHMLKIIPNKFMYSGVGSSDTVPVGDGLYLQTNNVLYKKWSFDLSYQFYFVCTT